ncbi:MAG: thiopurine S-methyltransferase [Gammaproteobacteria bacterium]|nr:thiopurine S-methyltransferase [Gammaproteobacteria bacterium]
MERDFWLERWENNQIGFHQEDYSPYLKEYWSTFNVDPDAEVFVPMAGKTRDMIWLANEGHKVLGIELSEIAVDAFFNENKLDASQNNTGRHIKHSAGDIHFLCGDFFHLVPEDTEHVKAVFDRASMVAMPPELRTKYAEHMAELLKPGTQILLVSMEYPEGEMSGPPFSVSESDIDRLYSTNFTIELLETVDVISKNPNLKDRGLTAMDDKIYRLVRK